MSDILNTYPVFEKNQVLTSTQLNNLVNYLDQQNRLTRARLIGMGVVCGLEIDYNKSENTITISKGTGITSEGYLISIGDCVTVKYRPYNLPPGTIYEPFVGANNKQDIVLHELITESAKAGSDDKLLDDEVFLADKVVLLFIESFDKDLKSCLGKSCDELGKERILTLRKLLISKTDLQKVWNRTNTGKLEAVFPEKFNLPVVNMQRVLFNPANSHSTDFNDFSMNYVKAIQDVFDKLIDALSETYTIYRPLLLESYDEKNPFITIPITERLAVLQNFLNNADATLNPFIGVQYVYDLFQDLILAYNEFKNTAFDLMSECSADMSRFPKHIMLGEAIPLPVTLCQNSECRHYFVQPPIYNLQKLLIQRTVSLHNRMVLMLESFDLKRINTINGEELKVFPIRITPSLEKTTALSLRSIPWYYDLKKKSSYAALGNLKKYWNFDVSRKCADEKEGLILNYEDQLPDQSVAKYKLGTPLFYDIQDYSFLRVERQIGVNINLAVKKLENLKNQFNLAFGLIALQLDPNPGSVTLDYKCGFEDIQEEYQMLKLNFCRFAADIRELYKFIDENKETLFDSDNENSADIKKYLEKLKEIIQLIDAVCKSLSSCINNFDFPGFQERYKSVLVQIIDFVLIDLELLQKINIGKKDANKQIPLINGIIQRLSPLAGKFFDLLFYNRFLRLYYSFKRREFYLMKQIETFSTYISKNPGIDHQAGVSKGGTLILVYINDEQNHVIADFSLPYLCCNKTNCIPMCDDEGGFVFEMKPFARPDYAITLVDIQVDIDVLRNDSNLFGGDFSIKSEEVSKFGGIIKQNSETGPLTYLPKKGFLGTDTFTYTLTDKKSGKSDVATVTVVVKSPEKQGCYSVQILECWGEKSVRATLGVRNINIPEGANLFEILLESLRKTGGFTEDEIFSNVLEEPERRRALLNCLGIANDDNTSYEQLGQLILGYQKSNCGTVQPAKVCYTVEILQCWGEDLVKETIERRQVSIPAGMTMFQALLNDLRKTGGFTESEIFSNVLEDGERKRRLLNCLGIPNNDNTTYEQLGQLILDYQKSNCGVVVARPSATIELGLLATNELVKVLEARGKTVTSTESRAALESEISSSGGNVLTEMELLAVSRDSLSKILNSKNVAHTTSENKTQLIKKLLG